MKWKGGERNSELCKDRYCGRFSDCECCFFYTVSRSPRSSTRKLRIGTSRNCSWLDFAGTFVVDFVGSFGRSADSSSYFLGFDSCSAFPSWFWIVLGCMFTEKNLIVSHGVLSVHSHLSSLHLWALHLVLLLLHHHWIVWLVRCSKVQSYCWISLPCACFPYWANCSSRSLGAFGSAAFACSAASCLGCSSTIEELSFVYPHTLFLTMPIPRL